MSTWIFLRGLTRERRHWGKFIETFRQGFPDAEVHAIDLPGNGRLHAERSPLDVTEMVERCRAQLRAHDVRPPFHVLAMSLGAMVAVAWASRYPEEIGGCVLINTSLRPFSPFYHRLKPGNYFPLLRRLLLGGSAHDWERLILGITSRQADRHGEVLKEWVSYRCQYPVSAGNALRQVIAAVRYRAAPSRPSLPMLILASTNDALVDPRCSRRLAQRWNSAFAEHPTAGHDLPLDDGIWVVQQTKRWLQG